MILEVLFLSVFSFILGYLILPKLIKSLVKNGLFGRDIHKLNKPKVAEPGGIALIFSFIFTIFMYMALLTYFGEGVNNSLFAGILTVMIAGIIGLVDDFLNIKWRTKMILAFFPALPLIVLKAGVSGMIIPLVGFVDFGFFYSLVLIPLMVNFAINEFNMVAGYNGLESGLAIVSMVTIIIASFLTNNVVVAVLVASMLGGTVAFFLFNKFPAKIFPGDTGTFLWGSLLITALIIGNMEKLALGIFFLYFIDFVGFLFCLKNGCRVKFAKIDSQERLHPSCGHRIYFALPYFFPNLNLKEKNITKIFVSFQVLICIISLIVFI
ncbi:MAG: hypothetical protein GON13_00680 [Nanoarchaeota archaeon]|nr:hypothetical protein [Nanoarchaeota archaeon]